MDNSDIDAVNQFVNFEVNGRIFPHWIMKNFAKYQLPKIIYDPSVDPCDIKHKKELYLYQEFVGKYIGPKTPYNSILLYHGLGSGKTIISINIINLIYEYDPSVNYIILIKASLKDDPWLKDLKIWLGHDPSETNTDFTKRKRYQTIHFVHYDNPFADKAFIELMKVVDRSKRTVYFVEESHNFIRNVYSNINSKKGKRAQVIYDFILKDRQENTNNMLILISGTPVVNRPFELSLLFNWLRPGTFPSSEMDFNRLFITGVNYPILNNEMKNYFQRRIIGLVSYYVGSNSQLYARREDFNINLIMSDYQYRAYLFFQKEELLSVEKAKSFGKTSQLYRTYTRQACNFVFPTATSKITAELRPRPGKFKTATRGGNDNDDPDRHQDTSFYEDLVGGAELPLNLLDKLDQIDKGKNDVELDDAERKLFDEYKTAIELFITKTGEYFTEMKNKKGKRSIYDDLNDFKNHKEKYHDNFVDYWIMKESVSDLVDELYNCSPKMTAILFNVWVSPGKILIYSNYVLVEGLRMMKIYLDLIDFKPYMSASKFKGYCEYHGGVSMDERNLVRQRFNGTDNVLGEKCLIILLSPSGVEGLNLLNIRQEHIMEDHWNEVRIQQIIGRGIRNCSHQELSIEERTIKVFRYNVIKPERFEGDRIPYTTDEYIGDNARAINNLNMSFLNPMKEIAVDCQLFKNHNQVNETYPCFKFPEEVFQGKNVGPAYVADMKDDMKNSIGLNAKNARVERVKVIYINAVIQSGEKQSPSKEYLLYKETGMCYDVNLHYPVGRVKYTDGIPNKLNKDTYVISDQIQIPIYHP